MNRFLQDAWSMLKQSPAKLVTNKIKKNFASSPFKRDIVDPIKKQWNNPQPIKMKSRPVPENSPGAKVDRYIKSIGPKIDKSIGDAVSSYSKLRKDPRAMAINPLLFNPVTNKASDFVGGIAQDMAKHVIGATANTVRGVKEFTPQSNASKLVFGKEPVKNLQAYEAGNEDWATRWGGKVGVSPEKAKLVAPLLTVGGLVGDATIGGGGKKGGVKVIQTIAKSDNVADIYKILAKGKDIVDPGEQKMLSKAAQDLVKITKEAEVSKYLDKFNNLGPSIKKGAQKVSDIMQEGARIKQGMTDTGKVISEAAAKRRGYVKYAAEKFGHIPRDINNWANQYGEEAAERAMALANESGPAVKNKAAYVTKILQNTAAPVRQTASRGMDIIGTVKKPAETVLEGARPTVEAGAKATDDIVTKLIDKMKSAKLVRTATDKLQAAEKAKRAAKIEAAFQSGDIAGAFGHAAGELPKPDFESLGLAQHEIDALIDKIAKSTDLIPHEKLGAINTLKELVGEAGGIIPTRSGMRTLEKVFGPNLTEAFMSKRDLGERVLDEIGDIVELNKSLITSLDVSAAGRQGILLAPRNPKEAAGAFLKQFQFLFSKKSYDDWMATTAADPDSRIMRQLGLELTDISSRFAKHEEGFGSRLAEKLPWISSAGRAYTGYLNKLRFDVGKKMLRNLTAQGFDIVEHPDVYNAMFDFVNIATGRGALKARIPGLKKAIDFEQSASLLNKLFFSPKLIASRFATLKYLIPNKNIPPVVRKEALKTISAFLGTGMSVLGLAAVYAKGSGKDIEVGTNPTSADFGKIRIGDTRIDIWGGYQQYAVLAARLIMGETTDSSGKVTDLDGNRNTNRLSIAKRFASSKLSPSVSLAGSLLGDQTDFNGDPLTAGGVIANNTIPLNLQDAYDAYKAAGPKRAGLVLGLSSLGVGTNTYDGYEQYTPGQGSSIAPTAQAAGKTTGNAPVKQYKNKQDNLNAVEKAKKQMEKTGEAKREVGDYIVLNKNGTLSYKPKTEYRYELSKKNWTLDKDKYKAAKDYDGWMKAADAHYQEIQRYAQTLDPQADEIELIGIQKELMDIVQDAAKYKSYGGFTKPKKAKVRKPTQATYNSIGKIKDSSSFSSGSLERRAITKPSQPARIKF